MKPILFSGPMIRALLAGTKTQTRRLVRPPIPLYDGDWLWPISPGISVVVSNKPPARFIETHVHIRVGDRLWVRESWRPDPNGIEADGGLDVFYPADGGRRHLTPADGWKMPRAASTGAVPSIHMPTWASRITLTVTDVRVQRLQDISDEDALAEGIDLSAPIPGSEIDINGQWWPGTYRRRYFELWDSINGSGHAGSWAANPWVAAYTFTVERTK